LQGDGADLLGRYPHGLGESLDLGAAADARELGAIARREIADSARGGLPGAMIVLCALGVLGYTAALWLATGVGVATLTIQGVRYALLERLSRVETMLTSPPISRSSRDRRPEGATGALTATDLHRAMPSRPRARAPGSPWPCRAAGTTAPAALGSSSPRRRPPRRGQTMWRGAS